MCLFVIVQFPAMHAESDNILDQVDKNQFSGEMVTTLCVLITVMAWERYIYKTNRTTFKSSQD